MIDLDISRSECRIRVKRVILAAGLVARFSQIEGYKCLSLTRALGVVKCQLALV